MQKSRNSYARAPARQFVLPEILDLRAASPLASSLLSARGESLSVDASKVVSIGAQCLQVILSAKLTWARDGHNFVITNPSEPFLESLKETGLAARNLMEGDIDT
jgi:chemotaxis protein CheX